MFLFEFRNVGVFYEWLFGRAGWKGNVTERNGGRKRNREAKCKKGEKTMTKWREKMCKIQKVCSSAFQKIKIPKFKKFFVLFFFLQKTKFLFLVCVVQSHNVLYTLHGFNVCDKKRVTSKRFNQRWKTTSKHKEWWRKKFKKWEECVISGVVVGAGKRFMDVKKQYEVKILFRCPAEKELFTTKDTKKVTRKKRNRKRTRFSIHCV